MWYKRNNLGFVMAIKKNIVVCLLLVVGTYVYGMEEKNSCMSSKQREELLLRIEKEAQEQRTKYRGRSSMLENEVLMLKAAEEQEAQKKAEKK